MDITIEQKFIKKFVEKNMQDRFLHELSSKDKRRNALSKFAHTAKRYLNTQIIYLQGKKLGIDEIEKEMKKLANDTKHCYVIAGVYDGQIMSLRDALEKSYDDYNESIIIVNESTAFIKTETESGGSIKYILHKKN